MRDVDHVAGAHFGQRLLGTAEGREIGRLAMLGDVGWDKLRYVVAAPGEEGRLIGGRRLGHARHRRRHDHRQAGGAHSLEQVPAADIPVLDPGD
jgi:hypothetical protein